MISIVTSDGGIFDPDNLKPKIVGFQIKHNQTGRILPSTTRRELYSKAAAIKKMSQTAMQFNIMQASLDIWEYVIYPVYDFEEPEDVVYINDKDDHLY